MRICLTALLLLGLMSTLSGCKAHVIPAAKLLPPNGPIVGRWHGGIEPPKGVFLEFKEDGTFSFRRYWTDVKGPETTMSGTYKLEGDKLSAIAQQLKTKAPVGANPKIKQYLREQDERAVQSGKGAADLNGTVTWRGQDAFILAPEASLAMEFVRLPKKSNAHAGKQEK